MNEQEIRLLQESFYVEELTLDDIFELINEQQLDVKSYKLLMERAKTDSLSISAIPEISITELGWSDMSTPETAKEFSSTARGQLMNFLKNIQGADLAEKLDSLQQFYDMDEGLVSKLKLDEKAANNKISAVLSYLVFYKTLTRIISNFNASSAGFSFESFLAVLLGGKQVPTGEGTIADLTTAGGTPISLKLYKEDTIEVGGSYRDLVRDLLKEPAMQYVVCAKSLSAPEDRPMEQEGTIKFYRFNFTLQNIFNILATSSKKSRRNIILPARYLTGDQDVAAELPTGGVYPAPQEVEKEFIDLAKEMMTKQKLDKISGIGAIDYNKLFRLLSYAKKDNIFSGSEPVRGASELAYRKTDALLAQAFPDANRDERKQVWNALNLSNKEIISRYSLTRAQLQRKSAIKDEYLQGSDAELISASVEKYNALSDEDKKSALSQTLGFVGSKAQEVGHFNLTGNMVLRISDELGPDTLPEANGGNILIGELRVGNQALQTMLNQVISIINVNIFDIFESLKLLTLNIKTYFAGGLAEDRKASAAIGAAENIGTKTKEVSGVE